MLSVEQDQFTEEEIEKLKRDAKIAKRISRKNNILPPNKVMVVKTKYKREKKNTRLLLEENEDVDY